MDMSKFSKNVEDIAVELVSQQGVDSQMSYASAYTVTYILRMLEGLDNDALSNLVADRDALRGILDKHSYDKLLPFVYHAMSVSHMKGVKSTMIHLKQMDDVPADLRNRILVSLNDMDVDASW